MPGKKTGPRTDPKAPSIYDVAREVSVFTVSAVINNKGRVSATLGRRVKAAIRKLNYRPNLLARSLAKQQTTRCLVQNDAVDALGDQQFLRVRESCGFMLQTHGQNRNKRAKA